jgi:hypothetical protein
MSLERRCYRWVQVDEDNPKLQELLKGEKPILRKEESYRFFCPIKKCICREFHVDSARELQQFIVDGVDENGEESMENRRKGGNLSCRMMPCERPIIMIGQDEAVFHQNHLSRKQWFLPSGISEIRPKCEGESIMASAFVNREDSLATRNEEHLIAVNLQRNGKTYVSQEAARKIRGGQGMKQDLTFNPCLHYFEIGQNRDGYWNSDQMVLQIEDCVDYIQHKYKHCLLVFFFDHSSGHDKTKEDGLNAARMSVGWGGAQPKMRTSVLTKKCIGPHNPKVSVGEEYSHIFLESDMGPWYEPSAPKYDISVELNESSKKQQFNKKWLPPPA